MNLLDIANDLGEKLRIRNRPFLSFDLLKASVGKFVTRCYEALYPEKRYLIKRKNMDSNQLVYLRFIIQTIFDNEKSLNPVLIDVKDLLSGDESAITSMIMVLRFLYQKKRKEAHLQSRQAQSPAAAGEAAAAAAGNCEEDPSDEEGGMAATVNGARPRTVKVMRRGEYLLRSRRRQYSSVRRQYEIKSSVYHIMIDAMRSDLRALSHASRKEDKRNSHLIGQLSRPDA